MSTELWIQIGVIFAILLYTQIGRKKVNVIRFLIPIAISVYFGNKYITAVSLSGNDIVALLLVVALGIVFGIALLFFTKVTKGEANQYYTQAGLPYTIILVISLAVRLGIAYYAEHNPVSFGTFLIKHQISPQVIAPAFMVMVLVMLVIRIGGILLRVNQLKSRVNSAS